MIIEINDFLKVYGISLASKDGLLCLLVRKHCWYYLYMVSYHSMLYVGHDLREALVIIFVMSLSALVKLYQGMKSSEKLKNGQIHANILS